MPRSLKPAKKITQKKVVNAATVPFPGYRSFTKQVYLQLKQSNKLFMRLIVLLTFIVIIFTFTSQQTAYIEQAIGIQAVSSEVSSGILAKLLETGVLFVTLISGNLTANLSETQQFIVSFVYLLAWLTVVWLLRQILSEKQVNVRDGVYSSGAPLVPTALVCLVVLVQLIPLAILAVLLSAIATTGAVSEFLIATGVIVVLAVAVVTLYWLVGTLFGAIIVTIPGTYPLAALRSARTIVTGKRAFILKRLLWLGLINLIMYIVVVIPVLFLDVLTGYSLSWITVTITIVLGLCLFLFSTTYLYLIYRRIIDEHTN